MRTSTVSIAGLEAKGRWRVEIFLEDVNNHSSLSKGPVLPLSSLCDEISEAILPQQVGTGSFSYIGLENIEPITGDLVGSIMKPFGAVRSRSKVFARGDVLYGRLRPSLRKVFCTIDVDGGLCSTEFIVLRPKVGNSPLVLRAILASDRISCQLEKLQTGAALPRVSSRDLMVLQVPVIANSSQNLLEKSLRKLEAQRKAAKAVLSSAAADLESAFSAALA